VILALELPRNLGLAVEMEAARTGRTASRWVEDRLADFFGLRAPARAATVKLFDLETDHAAPDQEDRP